ncbi:MAG: glycosyltransferase family 2 protein [Ignavibacteriae bacterium]|nr:glycosyltransferase family 2 protein [Ignavibacteriota bacterium]
MADALTISVVIPTRNRPEHLRRALCAIAAQTRPPDEVIVVDASDIPVTRHALVSQYAASSLRCVRTNASVCVQRNAGIAEAHGSLVFLCDDDIEVPPEYLETILRHFETHPDCGAVSGVVLEADESGGFTDGIPPPNPRALMWSFFFQLTVWADLDALRLPPIQSLLLSPILRWYRRRGNTFTLAGWPLVTQVGAGSFHTAVYGLGAAVVRREWLLASPFDEQLDVHGIGDNYGVALGFPGTTPVTVLPTLRVLHHRARENRLVRAVAHERRIVALRHLRRKRGVYTPALRRWLLWSIFGNMLRFALRFDGTSFRAAARAFRAIVGRQ